MTFFNVFDPTLGFYSMFWSPWNFMKPRLVDLQFSPERHGEVGPMASCYSPGPRGQTSAAGRLVILGLFKMMLDDVWLR